MKARIYALIIAVVFGLSLFGGLHHHQDLQVDADCQVCHFVHSGQFLVVNTNAIVRLFFLQILVGVFFVLKAHRQFFDGYQSSRSPPFNLS